jgi:hypothetical protein
MNFSVWINLPFNIGHQKFVRAQIFSSRFPLTVLTRPGAARFIRLQGYD